MNPMHEAEPVRLEALMTHREWVRRVALALVADVHEAADLEQDLWVKVLERPPRIRGSVRGWLAATLRNSFLNQRRGDARREARERLLAPPEARPSTTDVVADAEAVRRLMGEVLDLHEPYRTMVLLRFYEELLPASIATRMGVPVETVRTRLRRALAMLRDRLDQGSGGDGWFAALVPIAGVRVDAGAVAGKSGTAIASALGGAAMTGKTTIVVSVGLGLVAGFLGGRLSGATSSDPSPALLRRIEALETSGSRAAVSAGTSGEADPSKTASRLAEQDRRIQAIEAEVATTRGRTEELLASASGAGSGRKEEGAELRQLQGFTDEELLAEIRRLSRIRHRSKEGERTGNERMLQACEAFLGRPVEASQRIEVLTAKGITHRNTGDLDKAETALREALGLAGPTTADGRGATYQLAIIASARQDNRTAADLLFGAGRQSEAPPEDRIKFRWWGAGYLARVDPQGALAELRDVLTEYGTSEEPALRHWLDQVRKDIEKLERSGGAR